MLHFLYRDSGFCNNTLTSLNKIYVKLLLFWGSKFPPCQSGFKSNLVIPVSFSKHLIQIFNFFNICKLWSLWKVQTGSAMEDQLEHSMMHGCNEVFAVQFLHYFLLHMYFMTALSLHLPKLISYSTTTKINQLILMRAYNHLLFFKNSKWSWRDPEHRGWTDGWNGKKTRVGNNRAYGYQGNGSKDKKYLTEDRS